MTLQEPLVEAAQVDPVESAQAAGLRYVSDFNPGIQRKRVGKHFSYVGVDGRPIRDVDTLKRIKALGIPPAYTDVWICPDPRGHLQATGRDARGCKQYRYHARWRQVRDETKYNRMIALATPCRPYASAPIRICRCRACRAQRCLPALCAYWKLRSSELAMKNIPRRTTHLV